MLVNSLKSKLSPPKAGPPVSVKNSSRRNETFTLSTSSNAISQSAIQPKIIKFDNEVLENKHLEGEKISRILRFSSDSRIVQGLADRILHCSQRENFFLANDLHSTDTGELFDGKGSLWSCNSRVCPACIAKLSKRNRKIARCVFENEKVFLGERWFFLTFTMPDLLLKDFPLLVCRAIMNEAWRKFSRSVWFKKVIRGGMKSEEFTIGKQNQYHYHIHSLAICKNRITSNNFVEIRREWTKALRFAFKKYGLNFKCNTKDGLANVRVDKTYNKGKAILELCKYFTKSESWSKIPPEQLADIATIERFPRMFEVFGTCKGTVKAMKPDQSEKMLKTPANAENQAVENDEKANKHTYLDTKKITVRFENQENSFSTSTRRRKQSWRVRCRILPRSEWLKSLEEEINACREYRKGQLRHKFEFATFRTLDGQEF